MHRLVLGFSRAIRLTSRIVRSTSPRYKVSDISLNYLGNTLYMTQSTYEQVFGRSARLNGVFVLLKGSSADQIAFSKKLKSDGWLTISSTAEHWQNYEANFAIINSVVVLVTFMAACLSFVVVFTLSNTNISERERELATIKVLGFRRGEVHHYVNKETLILTAIGAALGVPLGGALARVLRTFCRCRRCTLTSKSSR